MDGGASPTTKTYGRNHHKDPDFGIRPSIAMFNFNFTLLEIYPDGARAVREEED